MQTFADTSFLCALYRDQDNSERADKFLVRSPGVISVSSLVLWEFRQSTRLQVFRFSKDRTKGFSKAEAGRMMAALDENLRIGALTVKPAEWPDVHSLAEKLSAQHTMTGGHRPMDILHLSTAIHLGIKQFLTFDQNQKELALGQGLKVPI